MAAVGCGAAGMMLRMRGGVSLRSQHAHSVLPRARSATPHSRQRRPRCTTACTAASTSQLQQLSAITTLSIDTGDLDLISEYAETGFITDATTNPLLVAQAALRGEASYAALVEEAVAFAKAQGDAAEVLEIAMDRLAVNLGRQIVEIVPGYVSTEVDPRLSFDTQETVRRGKRIIEMYEDAGVDRSRVLVKVAGTWEGIVAMEALEKEGIQCNVTLVFGMTQAVAAAQRGAHLISPFTGRILDWHKAKTGKDVWDPMEDPGVVECQRMYQYFKKYDHGTICMPASWRPSRGQGYDLDEIRALAGSDRMTIPPAFLAKLKENYDPLPRVLDPITSSAQCVDAEFGGGMIDENMFRLMLNADVCTTLKMAEGINQFIGESEKLEAAIRELL